MRITTTSPIEEEIIAIEDQPKAIEELREEFACIAQPSDGFKEIFDPNANVRKRKKRFASIG